MARFNIKLMILWSALIVLVIALGTILYLYASSLFFPRGVNRGQPGNVLKLPVLLEDLNPDPNVADFVLDVTSGQTRFFENQSTDTLGYNGSYLGPVLRLRDGEKVRIRVNNQLSFSTTVHWHGLVVDGEQDGGPHQGIQPGESWSPTFTVDQPAATLWFHPHFMGTTADQVYQGLSGLIYIDDAHSDQLNLPDDYGVNDIPLIVQDRSFNRDGSFDYRTSMMGVEAGDTILINGTMNPSVEVNKGKIRFRILNASNSQNFDFTLSDGSSFDQIASDGGFLESPVTRSSVFMAPGERVEVVVDFSKAKGDGVSLMLGELPILDIDFVSSNEDTTEIPQNLTTITPIPVESNTTTRLFELQGMGLGGTINGKTFNMNRIDEEVRRFETEVWIVRNVGGMMQAGGHPFHVHGTQFQIISRNGKTPPLEERGFKDTVYLEVGDEVSIRVRFTRVGIFMYHCHILEHEDNGMMGQFRVT